MLKVVEIELDKKRHLKFGVKAYPMVEKALGVPMDKVDFQMQETIYALLLGGLIWEDRKLTLDGVMDIVEGVIETRMEETGLDFMEVFSEVMKELSEKLGEAMGSDKKPKEQ